MRALRFSLVAAAALAVACGSNKQPFGDPDVGDGGNPFSTDDAGPPVPIGTLTGKVLAPEGTMPISGALLYLTPTPPPAIPDGVFCDKCVRLDASTPSTFSKPDGTFALPAYAKGTQYLVVQKGQFRRVRSLDVTGGDQPVNAGFTRLPPKTNAQLGDTIPKMAVVNGQWDRIEITLAKIGLGKLDGNGQLQRGTESFDIYENKFPPNPNDPFAPDKLLTDANVMNKYNIVFIPCSGSTGTTCDDTRAGQSSYQKTLQQFVGKGGKVYVTDYSYEFVRQPFPGFVTWHQQSQALGSACLSGEYDAPGKVDDKGLSDWLGAMGTSSVTLKANWTQIDALTPQPGTDENGKPATITPKVWMTAQTGGGDHPATISFQQSCGRVLFSTYHTEAALNPGPNATLLPQEQALLYVLLEVAVCVGPPQGPN